MRCSDGSTRTSCTTSTRAWTGVSERCAPSVCCGWGSAGRWRRCGDGGRTGGAPRPADRRCRSKRTALGSWARSSGWVRRCWWSSADRISKPLPPWLPVRTARAGSRRRPGPNADPISGPFTPGAGPDRPDRTTRQRRDRPRGQVASAGSRPPPAAVPAGQPDVSRLRRRHCVPHWAKRDDPRAHRGPIHAHGRGELRQRLHHRPRRSSRQRPHVHDGGCPRLPPQRPLVNEVSRGADPSRVVSPCHEQPAREPIAQLPLARMAALAVRPLRVLLTGHCESRGLSGNAARLGSAPMLCLCTTLAQDGLTARLLVVLSGREYIRAESPQVILRRPFPGACHVVPVAARLALIGATH